jgi:hypothetical protein
LKNLTVNYSLPSHVIKKLGLSKASVFVSGENLVTITKLSKIFDPETLNVAATGVGKSYPLAQVYSAGLSINF